MGYGEFLLQCEQYHKYTLLGSLYGSFDPNELRDTLGVLTFAGITVSQAYGYNSTNAGETINFRLSPVPEPSGLILVGINTAALFAIARRRRSR